MRELSPKELRCILHDIQETLWCQEYADDEQRSTGSGQGLPHGSHDHE